MKESSKELTELLNAWCNRTISPEERARLESILDSSAEARRIYRRHLNLHGALHERCDVYENAPLPSRFRIRPWILPGLAAALAIFAIAKSVFSPRDIPEESASAASLTNTATTAAFAVLTQAVGVVWESPNAMPHVGGAFPSGNLVMKSGLAHIDFRCGANVTLEGPARLELVSAMRGILHYGKLRAYVPEQAKGFSISVKQAEVVDLGTEFAIACENEGLPEIHVFEGEVELRDSTAKDGVSQFVHSGAAFRLGDERQWESIASDSARFADVSTIARLARDNVASRFENWKRAHRDILDHPALVAYYDFEPGPGETRTLTDRTGNGHHGAIVGCAWAEGRWPRKGALEFKQTGDRVRLNIPGQFASLTLVTWLRIDGFDRRFNSIFLSDRFEDGHAHWQVKDDGVIDLGVKPPDKKRVLYLSGQAVDMRDLGRWIHLGLVYDAKERVVTHFVDGAPVSRRPIRDVDATYPLQFGPSELGNWSPSDPASTSPIRNLNGRIDEFAIIGDALTAEEIANLFETGRPL